MAGGQYVSLSRATSQTVRSRATREQVPYNTIQKFFLVPLHGEKMTTTAVWDLWASCRDGVATG
jgi:hypothetical protein